MTKVLCLIDANGKYANGKHSTLVKLPSNYYGLLKNAIINGGYDAVLYSPNIPDGNDTVLAEACKTDPLLRELPPEIRKKIILVPKGYHYAPKWDEKRIQIENKFGESGSEFVVAGLYRDLCVQSHYDSLKSRFPDNKIGISENLSVLSPQGEMLKHHNLKMPNPAFEIVNKKEELDNLRQFKKVYQLLLAKKKETKEH